MTCSLCFEKHLIHMPVSVITFMEYSVVGGHILQHDPIGSKQLVTTHKCEAVRQQSQQGLRK